MLPVRRKSVGFNGELKAYLAQYHLRQSAFGMYYACADIRET